MHCFVASLGDGVMMLLLYGLVRLASGRGDWLIRPRLQDYAILAVAGVLMAIVVPPLIFRIAAAVAVRLANNPQFER